MLLINNSPVKFDQALSNRCAKYEKLSIPQKLLLALCIMRILIIQIVTKTRHDLGVLKAFTRKFFFNVMVLGRVFRK
ncbi:MAG: hypothetical protein A2X86_15960 [Bdellovibrionales bacterium GWA2_49_15]|nr:MAG: hypothetical protein A2X86_15960 [Bdellovibrionales bacterium GWA2_49_15]HAZ13179.1 hypothetical protein [Bdellovibrionales bacterium]